MCACRLAQGLARSKRRPPSTCNYGFDDDKGNYLVAVNDHIACVREFSRTGAPHQARSSYTRTCTRRYRYEVLTELGKGSFGHVVKCLDYKTNTLVAVKIIRNEPSYQKQALTEARLLAKLRDADPDDATHIVHIKVRACALTHGSARCQRVRCCCTRGGRMDGRGHVLGRRAHSSFASTCAPSSRSMK